MNLIAVIAFVVGVTATSALLPIADKGNQSPPADSDYIAMQARIMKSLDSVTGHDFIYNWFELLSDNVTVCYPFVGVVDADHCEVGIASVRRAWGGGPFTGETALQQDMFYVTKQGTSTVGVFEYTTSSSYMHNGTACAVQFNGVVMWRLAANNASFIDMWLEMPNSNRLASTYPCGL
jgi:hypothetical protein